MADQPKQNFKINDKTYSATNQVEANQLAAADLGVAIPGVDQKPSTLVVNTPAPAPAGNPAINSTAPSASTSAPATSEAATPIPQTYTIAKGDTLESIATKYGTNIQALQAANPSITNPNQIKTGSALTIPGAKNIATSPGKLGDTSKAIYGAVSKVPDQNDIGAVTAAGSSAVASLGAVDPINAMIAPFVANMSAAVQAILAPQETHQSLQEEYTTLAKNSGLDTLNTQLMNMSNVMQGTPDDIRNEITAAGGFASDSQVQAMATARNNTILKQYNQLSAQRDSAQNFVTTQMQFAQADQSERDTQQNLALTKIMDSTNIQQSMLQLEQQMQSTAQTQYKDVVTQVGYQGLAEIVNGNPYQQALAESSLGLPAGTLSDPDKVAQLQTFKQQQIAQGQQKINITLGGTDNPDAVQSWVDAYNAGAVTSLSAVPAGIRTQVAAAIGGDSSSGTGSAAKSVQSTLGVPDMNVPLSQAVGTYGVGAIVDAMVKNEGSSPNGVQNNPGNIKYTGGAGQVDSGIKATDGGTFASYKTPEAGKKAIESIITNAASGKSSAYGENPTLADFVGKYTNTGTDSSSGPSYSPLAARRFTMAANSIVANYINLPQYQLTANGLPYLQRIAAAEQNPGSVSDQDLLDSLTKLNTSGNAISDAQVKLITDGQSFADTASVYANKTKNGGVLSDNQRQQIQKIATAIYDNYKKGYQPVYDQAASQLEESGIPKQFWTIPDLNKLNKTPGGGGENSDKVNTALSSIGYSYDEALSKVPSGEVGIIRDGQFGHVPASEVQSGDIRI